jgi:hypothetical protein
LVHGHWTSKEDDILINYIKNGIITLNEKGVTKGWDKVGTHLGRTMGSCRNRWLEHLDPKIDHGAFSINEDKIIVVAQVKFGNSWARISKLFMGRRTSNAVKNRWNSCMRTKYQKELGIHVTDTKGNKCKLQQTKGNTTPKTHKLDELLEELVELLGYDDVGPNNIGETLIIKNSHCGSPIGSSFSSPKSPLFTPSPKPVSGWLSNWLSDSPPYPVSNPVCNPQFYPDFDDFDPNYGPYTDLDVDPICGSNDIQCDTQTPEPYTHEIINIDVDLVCADEFWHSILVS